MTSWQSARQLVLSVPDAEEHNHSGSLAFCVGGKIFAQLSKQDDEAPRVIVKLPCADQVALTLSDPGTFSMVPSWGQHGWTYIELATVDAPMLHDLLWQSWRQVATKKRIAAHEARS